MAFPRTSSRRLVALALGSMTENDLAMLEGARSVAARHRDWEFLVLPGGYEASLRQLAQMNELHGAIGDFVSDAWLHAIPDRRVQWVQIAQISRLEHGINVTAPYSAMGARAAEALQANGCARFAFAGVAGQFATQELAAGFAGELAARGRQPAIAPGVSPAQLREFLRELQPPLGVLAASDRLARHLSTAAQELGHRCPEDVAVIGVGNQRLESLHAGLALSSFELPSREIGRQAAGMLARLFAGESIHPGLYPAAETPLLHERASSLRPGRGVERALAFARSHLAESLQVNDLAHEAGMSRRAFELTLQREHGTSPATWLRGLRKERAEDLLRTSTLSIQEVGQRCGYPELAAFSAAFKQWTGRSPRAFRQNEATLRAT